MSNKIIHYCWFGGNPKPAIIEKCIASWKKFFPDFEIMEWNESNFDVNCCKYVQQAYEAKKYAFVSDYARFFALEKMGGLYFDTDVEVIKPFYELFENEAFAGFETNDFVNPGLVLWVKEPHNPILCAMLEQYQGESFLKDDGKPDLTTICVRFTNELKNYGFEPNNKLQKCAQFTLYPIEYFNPFDDLTGKLSKTENTYAIHWYSKTWMSAPKKLRNKITRILHRVLGKDFFHKG
ncbi:MAG: glycosyl transferase [Clostridia bacterium]|nr:glycosyl transferase [Clostridia bacterium]